MPKVILTLIFLLGGGKQSVIEPMPDMMACMVQAQLQASLWLRDHPKGKLVEWSCGTGQSA